MMVLFFHAARLALVVVRSLPGIAAAGRSAELAAPPGKLIVDDQYYTFSSVFFYTNRRACLLNGRVNNLVYGSYAPGAPRRVSRRRGIPAALEQRGALLPGGGRS